MLNIPTGLYFQSRRFSDNSGKTLGCQVVKSTDPLELVKENQPMVSLWNPPFQVNSTHPAP